MVSGILLLNGFRRMQLGSLAAAQKIRCIRLSRRRCQKGVVYLLICITVITATLAAVGLYHVYFDRTNLPDMEPFARFEFPTIGHVYDANGQPLIEMAREYGGTSNMRTSRPLFVIRSSPPRTKTSSHIAELTIP